MSDTELVIYEVLNRYGHKPVRRIRVFDEWLSCNCCGYREHVELCLLDGSEERDIERAYVCPDCVECASPDACEYRFQLRPAAQTEVL